MFKNKKKKDLENQKDKENKNIIVYEELYYYWLFTKRPIILFQQQKMSFIEQLKPTLKELFDVHDLNGDGVISVEEFSSLFKKMNPVCLFFFTFFNF